MSSNILDDVQGNILKGFNRRFVWLLFFYFENPEDTIRANTWLAKLAFYHYPELPYIPSTTDLQRFMQSDIAKDNTTGEVAKVTWLHVAFTRSGIEAAGLAIPPSKGVYSGKGSNSIVKDPILDKNGDPFCLGMKKRAPQLGDYFESDQQNWKAPFRDDRIDVLFLVASDCYEEMVCSCKALKIQAESNGLISHPNIEKGHQIIRNNYQIEHFGFREGISQPLIKGIDDLQIVQREKYKDEFDAHDFVLFGLKGDLKWANNGSFLALRILRQDVHGFWDFMKLNGPALGLTKDQLAAKIFGRWKDGASLTRGPQEDADNDFLFEKSDYRGENIPRFSHIRKANPRDLNEQVNNHRILRRSVPYGPEWKENDATDRSIDRGLLFVCYQRDLVQQFEHIQSRWANTENFPFSVVDNVQYHGPDPISGQHFGRKGPISMFLKGGVRKEIGTQQWVAAKGGEYFFSPSLSALRALA